MTDHDEPQHRAFHQSDPGRVQLREEDDEDGVFAVRMPIASTGEVRNEGDDPLERDELDGMARQIEDRSIGVFLNHGWSDLGGDRYAATGKLGEWANPELVEGESSEDLLEADARLMDPDSLDEATGAVREALAAIKAQVERGFALSSSIGWREDEDAPGGNDLMEASIVGIGADPRTTSDGAPAVVARAAVEAGADGEELVATVRDVVMGSDADGGDMTDEDTETQSDAGDGEDGTTDEQDEMDAQEYRESMLEMQRQQTETLSTLADAIRDDEEDEDDAEDDDGEEDGDDEEEDEEDQEGDSDDEDEDDENSQSLEVGDEEYTAEDLRELREQLADADVDVETGDAETDDEQDADATETSDQSGDGPDWRA